MAGAEVGLGGVLAERHLHGRVGCVVDDADEARLIGVINLRWGDLLGMLLGFGLRLLALTEPNPQGGTEHQ